MAVAAGVRPPSEPNTAKLQQDANYEVRFSLSLPPRIWAFIGILALECLLVAQVPHPWLHIQQLMATPIVFGGAILFFGRKKLQTAPFTGSPLKLRYALLHLLALILLAVSSFILLHMAALQTFAACAGIGIWYTSILLIIGSLLATLFPLRRLGHTLLDLRSSWIYASLITVLAMSARTLVRWTWDAPNSHLGRGLQIETLAGTKALLGLFYPNVVSDPNTALLGTPKFQVIIAGTCSGIEGLALILMLTVGWLIFARRELRLERAILLVPVALTFSWLLNLARIAALIAIGDAGHADVAKNGFHSEAGWIIFNAIGLVFLFVSEHLRWLHKDNISAPETACERNVAASYLLPFLAVLATSLITNAASNGFDRLYPLRFLVAIAILWSFHSQYKNLDWRFGWLGPSAGVVVFALWIEVSHWRGPGGVTTIPNALSQLPGWQRITWLALRTLSAVLTVPVAEELAFRGYIARRIMSADVESVTFDTLSFPAIVVSSAAFGLLHGRLWIAGIASGLVFALVAKLRGRLGEAVAAHTTANLLLALWILVRGDYSLW